MAELCSPAAVFEIEAGSSVDVEILIAVSAWTTLGRVLDPQRALPRADRC
jgi:hypothetical protein